MLHARKNARKSADPKCKDIHWPGNKFPFMGKICLNLLRKSLFDGVF